MKMKKIIAPTVTLAMKKVKEELGPEAIIFQTRKVTDWRFLNLIKKEHVEVLAAVDTDVSPTLNSSDKRAEKYIGTNGSRPSGGSKIPYTRTHEKVDRLFKGPEMLDNLRSRLIHQGISEKNVESLLQILIKKWYQHDERLSESEMKSLCRSQLMVKVGASRFEHPDQTSCLMLVGPTGVGKTTTLAKLAGSAVLDHGIKIALITIDTYRIAAIDQLRKYAEILAIPMAVAYSLDDLKIHLSKFAHFDRIFIDTAGRNFLDPRYVREIEAIAKSGLAVETALVFSATTKYEDMDQIMKQFERAEINHFIFSKMDETTTYGAIVNLLIANPKQDVLYITNGQDVPDDLQKPDLQQLIDKIMGDEHES